MQFCIANAIFSIANVCHLYMSWNTRLPSSAAD